MSNPDTALTASSLDSAATPSSSDADDGDNTKFPYSQLPDTAKVQILVNIDDPQDKLDILRMMPQLTVNAKGYDITDWDDYTSLQFELIYPLVFEYLKWPYETDARGWKNLLNLSKVSPSFQRIVTSHFEKYITLTQDVGNHYFREYRQEQIWREEDALEDILTAAPDKISSPWHTTLPFGIVINIYKRSQIPMLTKLGNKLWSLWLSLLGAYRTPGSINYLVECLRLAPNLRRLALEEFHPPQFSQYNLPPEVLHEERLVLPELPYLKMIALNKDCTTVQKWVLPKYTRQIEVMDFEDCYLAESFSPSCFPKVETININFSLDREQGKYLHANIDQVNDLLKKFLLSKLKVITVLLDKVDVAKFFNFMLTLNHFGETLDTLEMKFGTMSAEMEVEVKNGLRGWISQLNFPKLSCLHLENYVGPLEFLLKMPALRKLNIVTNSLMPLQFSNVNGLRFTVQPKGMLESSIWRLFPALDWLQVDLMVYEERDAKPMNVRDANGQPAKLYFPSRRHAYNISPQMYENHQRNKKH